MEMKYIKQLNVVIPFIVIGSMIEALAGIFSNVGDGTYLYKTIRGEMVEIYGKGVYRHMTTDVAVQGIAQDYITLFLAIPLLILSFFFVTKGNLKAKLIFSGVLLYFLLTYLFYIAIALYNELFLIAVLTLFCSLFAFILNIISFDFALVKSLFSEQKIINRASVFLIIIATMMSLLWLSVIIPPMIDGSFYPKELYHYSTMIVQGYDLAIFLPLAFISGILGLQKNEYAYVLIPTYLMFLTVLMVALVAKIIFMARIGENVIPVIFIIPTILTISIFFIVKVLKSIKPVASNVCFNL